MRRKRRRWASLLSWYPGVLTRLSYPPGVTVWRGLHPAKGLGAGGKPARAPLPDANRRAGAPADCARLGRVRIATWNVNSVTARLHRLVEWLDLAQPDVLTPQEIKTTTAGFPSEPV